jgi:pimeloyl-ACP methyl ester carboxylesterase
LAQLVDDAAQMAPPAFTALTESLSHWNRFADARQLTLPTLVVWGEQDEIVSREATTRTLIAIPGAANLEILRGVGHSPQIEAPLTLAEQIIEFIAEDFAEYGQVRSTALGEPPATPARP